MKKRRKWFSAESGQTTAMTVILMGVIMAGAAFGIDLGTMYLTQIRLQQAADNAALAGALELPSDTAATQAALANAADNGMDEENVTVHTPYEGDSYQIEVICEEHLTFGFAAFLGLDSANLSARAVAAQSSPVWNGEAFPFVNLDDDYTETTSIELWEKTGPGDFESLWKTEYTAVSLGSGDDHSQGCFVVDYADGLTVTKGVVATIKQEIGYLYAEHRPGYVFSLSSEAMASGRYDSLKNKQVIPLEDLVLLQVTFDSYDLNGKHLYMTVLDVYDINNGEYPTEYVVNGVGSGSSLVD